MIHKFITHHIHEKFKISTKKSIQKSFLLNKYNRFSIIRIYIDNTFISAYKNFNSQKIENSSC